MSLCSCVCNRVYNFNQSIRLSPFLCFPFPFQHWINCFSFFRSFLFLYPLLVVPWRQIIQTPRYLLTLPQILSPTSNQICLTSLNEYIEDDAEVRVTLINPRTNEEIADFSKQLKSGKIILIHVIQFSSSYHLDTFLQKLFQHDSN